MHVVERAEAIGRDANAPWVWHRGLATELGYRKFELGFYRSGVLFSSKIEGIISGENRLTKHLTG